MIKIFIILVIIAAVLNTIKLNIEKDYDIVPAFFMSLFFGCPIGIALDSLATWGIFALTALVIPFTYTAAVVIAVAAMWTIVQLILKDFILIVAKN